MVSHVEQVAIFFTSTVVGEVIAGHKVEVVVERIHLFIGHVRLHGDVVKEHAEVGTELLQVRMVCFIGEHKALSPPLP